MALKEVGIELNLLNESAYKAGLAEIANSTRRLSAETKLAVASLGRGATQTDKYQASMKGLSRQLKHSENTTASYERALKKLPESQKKIKEAENALTQTWKEKQKEIKELKNNYHALGQSQGYMSKQTMEAGEKLNRAREISKTMSDEIERLNSLHDKNALRMKELPTLIAESKLETMQYRQEMQLLHDEWRKNGGVLEPLATGFKDFGGTLKNIGRRMIDVGSVMTQRVTLPMVAGFGLAIKEAMAFNSQIEALGPLMAEGGNITAHMRMEMTELAKASRNYGVEYAKSTTDINNAMAEFVRTGFSAQETMKMMPHLLDASIATGENFNDVMARGIEGLMQFGLNTGDFSANMQRVMDSYTHVANATKSGITDIGTAMSYVGSTANGLGISLEETASMIGILSNRGIDASMAGTGLRAVLSSLANPTKNTGKAMHQLGIDTEAFKRGALSVPEIIDNITDATKDLTEEQRTALLMQAFGRVGANAMNALVAEGSENLRTLTKEAENATGVTGRMAEQMRNTPEFKFQQSIAQLKDLGIQIGQKLLPHFENMIAKVGEWVNAFSRLDSSTQNAIIKTGLFVAALGPLLIIAGSVVTAISNLSNGLGWLVAKFGALLTPVMKLTGATSKLGAIMKSTGILFGTLTNPIALVTGGVTALALAYNALTKDSREAKKAVEDFPNIDGVTHEQAQSIRATQSAYSDLTLALEVMSEETLEYSGTVKNAIGNIISEIERLNSIDPNVDEFLNTLPPAVRAIAEQEIESQRQVGEHRIARSKEAQDTVMSIRRTALEEGRQLTELELSYERGILNEMAMIHAESLAQTSEQGKQIYATMTADLEHMELEQLRSHATNVAEAIRNLDLHREETANSLKKHLGEGTRAYKNAMTALELETSSSRDKIFGEWVATLGEVYDEYNYDTQTKIEQIQKDIKNFTGKTMEAWGYSVEDIINFMENGGARVDDAFGGMFKGIDKAPARIQEAANKMKFALLNLVSEIDKPLNQLSTDELVDFGNRLKELGYSWNDLRWLLSEEARAFIDDNTREFLQRVHDANGEWEKEWEDKKLGVDFADEELVRAIDSLETYNGLTMEEKIASLSVLGQEELITLLNELIDYDSLTVEQKEVIVNARGLERIEEVMYALNGFNAFTPEEREIIVRTQSAQMGIEGLLEYLGAFQNESFNKMFVNIDTNAPEAQQLIVDALYNSGVLDDKDVTVRINEQGKIEVVNALGEVIETTKKADSTTATVKTSTNALDTKNKVDSTTRSVNTLNRTTANPRVNLLDGASGAIASIRQKLGVLNGMTANTYINTHYRTTGTPSGGGAGRQYAGFGAAYKDGGHIDKYADGGEINWGGMFARGGRVPVNYMGIVGEAGAELFHVTDTGVNITPLSQGEKMRGIKGAIEDYLGVHESKNKGDINVSVNLSNITIRDDRDIDTLAKEIGTRIAKATERETMMRKGRAVGHA